MFKTKKSFIVLSLIIISNYLLVAQSKKVDTLKNISAIAKVEENKVIIRWAPPDYIAWQFGNKSGYKVLRYRVNFAGEKPVEETKISNDLIAPFSLEQWKASFPQDHKYAPIAAQALYGKRFQISETDFDINNIRTLSLEQELRYSFSLLVADLDADVASALGLRVLDETIEKDEQYLYLIIPNDVSRMDTGFVFVDTRNPTPIPKAPALEKNEMENLVELRWSTEDVSVGFTAYWIERSEDGKEWVRLNKTPYLQATQDPNKEPDKYIYYTDTTITRNYLPYKYRLIGITPFADLSEPSNVVEAMGRDVTAPHPPVITAIEDIGGKIQIDWTLDEVPDDLKGFLIGKSSKIGVQYDKVTDEILSKSTRKFIDENPNIVDENYYVVFAVDTANNVSVSMPAYGFLKDSIPPLKPIGLKGIIDTNGIVTLRWTLGDDLDITGYRVYFANATDHEFSNITPYPIQDTVFVDTLTLRTLTKEIFYQIAAVDRNFNHSERSDILKLLKPDIVPPVAPLISNYSVSDTAVVLQVIPSSSDDVAKHILLRKGDKHLEWIQIDEINYLTGINNIVIDNNVTGLNFYQYAIQAVDSSGNKSALSPTISVKVYQSLKKIKINNIKALYDAANNSISIRWNKPQSDFMYYVIYKKVNNNRMENYASVDSDETSFTDNEILENGRYQYGIKAILKNGESKITTSSTIEVNKE